MGGVARARTPPERCATPPLCDQGPMPASTRRPRLAATTGLVFLLGGALALAS